MDAISLWQPWASLWCSPRKVHETRHWPTLKRGWIVVHAAKHFERDVGGELDEILTDEFGPHYGQDLPTGALVGAVNLVACKTTLDCCGDCQPDDLVCGNFGPNRFAWERRAFVVFARPIPYRGSQGFFRVRLEDERPIHDAIARAEGT